MQGLIEATCIPCDEFNEWGDFYKRRHPWTCQISCCKAKTWRQIAQEDSNSDWEAPTEQASTFAASLAKMAAGGSPIMMIRNSEYKDKDGKPLGLDYSDDAPVSAAIKRAKGM